MKFSNTVILSIYLGLVSAGQAPKIKKNPAEVVAIADFPFGGQQILGNVVFTAKKGKEVNVHMDVTKLPKEGGPFYYHIHENPIPENGDCEAAGLHFNPYDAPANCDDQKLNAYCQVGDLSGKHGWIDTTCFETKYDDKYLSLNSKSKSSIIGKSIVFHYANLKKFACANIEIADDSRLKSLELEYDKSGNNDLVEVKQFVSSSNQQFIDDEEYEFVSTKKRNIENDDEEFEFEEEEEDQSNCHIKEHHHNNSNYSNFTNLSSIEYDNSAILWGPITAIGLGVAMSLLL